MDVVGYCFIKKNATTGVCKNPKKFLGKTCRVMEFAADGGVLIIDTEASEMAMFEAPDVLRKFKCSVFGEYIIPPGLNEIEKMFYMDKLMNRKGGYNSLIREMVIQASLHKNEYNDNFLWQLQDKDVIHPYDVLKGKTEEIFGNTKDNRKP